MYLASLAGSINVDHGVVKRAPQTLVRSHHKIGAGLSGGMKQCLEISIAQADGVLDQQPVQCFRWRVVPQSGFR